LATTWIIWWTHYNIVFRGEFVNVTSLVHQIIYQCRLVSVYRSWREKC
jgi:hypothetical protein